jgi:putative ABC transport system ATP-binding protein
MQNIDPANIKSSSSADTGVGVRCRHLSHSYSTTLGSPKALDDVSVDIRMGELTLLVGPSGCGKTTLISIIAGLLRPSDGSLAVMNQSLYEMRQAELLRLRLTTIGFIFQQFNLMPGLTAAENVAVPLIAAKRSFVESHRRACVFLSQLGLSSFSDRYPRHLSVGQQQRVAIARALVHEPKLVLCDEPTASLDSKGGGAVMKILKELAVGRDRAAIVVTHDPRVLEFGDRCLTMEDGRLLADTAAPMFESASSVFGGLSP